MHTRLSLLLTVATLPLLAAPTRGIGQYPGDPDAYMGARLQPGDTAYRNLALHRPAFASSAHDYNLTAQLVTDGIRDMKLPRWFAVSTQGGKLDKQTREHPVDHNTTSGVELVDGGWMQLDVEGRELPAAVDSLQIVARPETKESKAQYWNCVVMGSEDGKTWKEVGRSSGREVLMTTGWETPAFLRTCVPLSAPSTCRHFRVRLEAQHTTSWSLSEAALLNQGKALEVGGPYDFVSAWKSASAGPEWVMVDLGAESKFDKVVLHWIRRAQEGEVQASSDGKTWKKLAVLPNAGDKDELKVEGQARYVRVCMTKAASPEEGYILSELEVFGQGGLVPKAQPALVPSVEGRLSLARGAWQLQRDSLVDVSGETLSKPGFQASGWLPATVPGTILSSYVDAGAVPDPNFGSNQLQISDSYFWADFWYRDEFVAPALAPGQRQWLNFDGINWKAEVYLNGRFLGRIEGGFKRGRFDVTDLVRPGQANALAVRVIKNATPGSVKEKTFLEPDMNGGGLGADNPTFHASVGWDWIPTIRGRNTGIWGEVYLSRSGAVTLEKPYVKTDLTLPDTSSAEIALETVLKNHGATAVKGVLKGSFGDVKFEKAVEIPAASELKVSLDSNEFPGLRLKNPKLWWPAGYGAQDLYDVKLAFEAGGVSDTKAFKVGVRKFTYSDEGGSLRIFINGRRFIARGGNWGFSESMLRFRDREFDASVKYHKDMNFTMIRNWVGQTGDEAFFEACDRHGIVVWQDFWLANPWDGPNPDDNALFMANAEDFVERLRNHASIGLYCGRNEGNPPAALNQALEACVGRLSPGIRYIPHSAAGLVSGGGPYRALPTKFYFEQRATPKLHSELGMPNIPNFESLQRMMAPEDQWPMGNVWGLHDMTMNGAQGGITFCEALQKNFGGAQDAKTWTELAQIVNYDGYRAMFESQSKHRMGVLLWMSHPCWPSFVWQTYDFDLEPTAAYFGCKKACEPLHVQWNPLKDQVEVVNYSAGNQEHLTVRAELLNLDGKVVWQKSAELSSAEDSVASPFALEFPAGLAELHVVRLTILQKGRVRSENVYWRSLKGDNFTALRALPKVELKTSTTMKQEGGRYVLETEVANPGTTAAMLVRLKAVRATSGDQILPVLYEDNYLTLMPGEKRRIRTEVQERDTRGEAPRIVVSGLNVQ